MAAGDWILYAGVFHQVRSFGLLWTQLCKYDGVHVAVRRREALRSYTLMMPPRLSQQQIALTHAAARSLQRTSSITCSPRRTGPEPNAHGE